MYSIPCESRVVRANVPRMMRPYQQLVAPITRELDAEIEEQGEALKRDMELRNLAHQMGDRESLDAFEFRMRETYGEFLPRVVVRGMVNLMPHLFLLSALYYLLPVVELPGGARVSTVSAYIAVGIGVMLVHHYRAWRRRAGPMGAGCREAEGVEERQV